MNCLRDGELQKLVKYVMLLIVFTQKPIQIENDTGNILIQLNNIVDIGVLDFTEKFYISDEDYAKWTSRIELKPGDCVITNVGRYGAVSQMPDGYKAAIGRNITALRLKEEYIDLKSYLITLLTSEMDEE